MKKLLVFCFCISAIIPALAEPNEYQLKLTPAETNELGKGLADRVKDAQALLGLVQKLQQQLDQQNKAAAPAPVAPGTTSVPEESKP